MDDDLKFPYNHDYPLWPFTKLTPEEMRKFEKLLAQKKRDETEEALL